MNARNAFPMNIQTPKEVNARNAFLAALVTRSGTEIVYNIILYIVFRAERVPDARQEHVPDVVGPWR